MEFEENDMVRIEWRIENFSCWTDDGHETWIESPHSPTLPDFQVLLYPGLLTDNEMHVSCFLGKLRPYEGELFFFGPDESLLRTVEIKSAEEADDDQNAVHILAPNLMDVVESRQENHGDNITLKFEFRTDGVHMAVGMCTTLEVISDMVLPFTGSKLLEDPQLGEDPKLLLAITYNRPGKNGGEEEELLHLERVFFFNNRRILDLQLRTITNWAFRDILIKTRLRVFDHANSLIYDDDCYHIFDKAENMGKDWWHIPPSLPRDRLLGSRVVLHLRFISGKTISSTNSKVLQGFSTILSESSPELSKNHSPPVDEKESPSSLKKELMCLYQDKEFTDFELHCGNTTFPVHKAILSARSPFFKQLLSKDMKGEVSGSVDIEDLDVITLNQFLAFLYSGTVEDLQSESAIKLYYAADKYLVPTLKTECVTFLSANISIPNACTILSLADKYKDAQLSSVAQDFIMGNFKEVAKSNEWHSYMISDPLLLVKTISGFAAKGYFN